MSRPVPPKPAKLVIGLFTRHIDLVQPIVKQLNAMFGPIELISSWLEFNWTDYYAPEMGSGLRRRMIAFTPLIRQESLPNIKHQTNALEAEYAQGGNRPDQYRSRIPAG